MIPTGSLTLLCINSLRGYLIVQNGWSRQGHIQTTSRTEQNEKQTNKKHHFLPTSTSGPVTFLKKVTLLLRSNWPKVSCISPSECKGGWKYLYYEGSCVHFKTVCSIIEDRRESTIRLLTIFLISGWFFETGSYCQVAISSRLKPSILDGNFFRHRYKERMKQQDLLGQNFYKEVKQQDVLGGDKTHHPSRKHLKMESKQHKIALGNSWDWPDSLGPALTKSV